MAIKEWAAKPLRFFDAKLTSKTNEKECFAWTAYQLFTGEEDEPSLE